MTTSNLPAPTVQPLEDKTPLTVIESGASCCGGGCCGTD